MGFLFSKSKNGNGSGQQQEFIDLRTQPAPQVATGLQVKVCEVSSVDDARKFADLVYDGHMLLLDFNRIKDDEIALKRMTTELKRVVEDVGGDLAGYGQHTLLVTPTGVAVDRDKVRVS